MNEINFIHRLETSTYVIWKEIGLQKDEHFSRQFHKA